MLKDLTTVFKKRWPEMLLIVGFMAIGRFLELQIITAATSAPTPALIAMSQKTLFLYSATSMIFNVLFLTLYLGFLATLNVNYTTPHTPETLIRIGRFFFWRTIRFLIIFSLYLAVVSILIFSPVKFLFFRTIDSHTTMLDWAFHICSIIAVGALAKLLLLVSPIMICKNLVVLPAVKYMSNYRLSDAKALTAIFTTGLIIYAAISTLHMLMDTNAAFFQIITAVRSILFATLTLLTGMIGIWFVAGKRFGALQEIPEETTEETMEENR